MKKSQVTTIYSQLTPPLENGNLAFEALIHEDLHEVDVINKAIEKHLYKMPDIQFRSRSQHLINLSLYY